MLLLPCDYSRRKESSEVANEDDYGQVIVRSQAMTTYLLCFAWQDQSWGAIRDQAVEGNAGVIILSPNSCAIYAHTQIHGESHLY